MILDAVAFEEALEADEGDLKTINLMKSSIGKAKPVERSLMDGRLATLLNLITLC